MSLVKVLKVIPSFVSICVHLFNFRNYLHLRPLHFTLVLIHNSTCSSKACVLTPLEWNSQGLRGLHYHWETQLCFSNLGLKLPPEIIPPSIPFCCHGFSHHGNALELLIIFWKYSKLLKNHYPHFMTTVTTCSHYHKQITTHFTHFFLAGRFSYTVSSKKS